MNFSVPSRASGALLVERRGVVHQLLPAVRGMDVDLDHAGIGRDQQLLQRGSRGGS
jgi:hypothetical protein